VLLGAAFGTLAHLSPAQRAQGAQTWKRIENWAENLSPSEVGALATLRTAQHLNEDSAPGKIATPEDVEAHAARVRQAIDQILKDQPVEVNDLAVPEVKPDDARFKQAAKRAEALTTTADRVAKAEGLPAAPEERPAPTIEVKDEPEGSFVTVKTEAGIVAGRVRRDELRVVTADIPDAAMRGKGFGKQMYVAMAEYAER
jgi:hypothetical protein